MKKFIAFSFIILGFTILCIFFTEKTDVLSLKDIPFETTFQENQGKSTLSWKRLPYPCYYEVEVLTKNPKKSLSMPKYHLLKRDFTFRASYDVPSTALPTYYRITAYGLFGPIGKASTIIRNPIFANRPLIPTPITKYTTSQPASQMPYLIWHTVPGGVYYELELLTAPPEQENNTELSALHHLFSTRAVFTNGWQADLKPFVNTAKIYWRVRALDFLGQPVGVFSTAEEINVDPTKAAPNKPVLNSFDRMPDFEQPLYPVYNWIPLHNIVKYEVELLISPPVQENNTQPTKNRIWYMIANDSSSCYDEYPRLDVGDYYWRVRAIDDNGNTIGVYSDSQKFTVKKQPHRVDTATFGDSITHGGGALSYSPANLEYSYETFLDFPTLNLGRSGDTSEMTADRFEQDVLPFHPKNLIILCGSNSIRADTTADSIINDLKTIQRKCELNDVRPIFLTLMPINPRNIYAAFQTDTDPNWQQKIMDVNNYIREQPYFIDLEPYFYDDFGYLATEYATDGLHPDIKGKQLMAEIINLHQDLLRK
jgi:lysophospholipase L1-like esterase